MKCKILLEHYRCRKPRMRLEFCKSDDTVIGILSVRLILRSSRSLKEKRRIIKGLKDRIKNEFNVSISETGTLDNCQYARLGIAIVGNDRQFLNGVLSRLINVFGSAVSFELVDQCMEFISFPFAESGKYGSTDIFPAEK
ncbi:MAG: DUF503 domain-containing protein [Candidatus Brocadiaceae bacterium]|nr:DUF503 domain-containing protein [Candidatus Brocadiaceae bacterium]